MGHPKTTIELNGKLYDATTGAMVDGKGSIATASKPAVPSSGITMDGFFRRPTTQPAMAAPRAVTPAAPKPARTHTAKPAVRQREHAQTLMRHVVKKPAAPAAHPVATKPKATHHQPAANLPVEVKTEREHRASHVPKSSAVSRFGSVTAVAPSVEKRVAPLAVQPHPEAPAHVAPPAHQQAPAHQTGSSTFHKALENAHSHQQAPVMHPKIRHRAARKLGVSNRVINIAAGALVVVLLTGFVAYQNVPNISMRLAASKAGINANLPGYTPSGFGMSGAIQSSPGAVTVSFRSRTDNRSYTVTQKTSDWTSDSLRANFFTADQSPTAYQDKGKTIYLYDNGTNAAWVNGGVLYQVNGNSSLNSNQIINIANSL